MFRAVAEEAQWSRQAQATTLAVAGSWRWDKYGAESTTIKQHILFPATDNIFTDRKITFLSSGCPLS